MSARKNINKLILFFSLSALAGCSAPFGLGKKSEPIKVYWKNYDGSILQIEELKALQFPKYTKDTPARATDDAATYTFSGWDKEIVPTLVTDKVVEYVATFESTPREYKISWLNYDDSLLAETMVPYGTVPTYSGDTPTRQGDLYAEYTFAGWDRELVEVKGATSYKAVFTKTGFRVVSINYYFNETVHSVTNPNINKKRAGETLNLQAASCAGYDFGGWFLDAAHTKPVTVLPNLQDNISIYGVFNIHTYSISYVLGEGGEVSGENPAEITCLEKATLLNPTRTGYQFVSWKDQHGNNLTKLEDVCEDLVLTANYNANEYVITLRYYEKNDEYITIKYDQAVNLPQLSKNGYKFLGWYYENNQDEEFTLEKYTLLEDVTLVQKWSEPIVYNIEYVLGEGGVNPDNAPTTYSIVDQPALPTPTKDGYDFDGWYDNGTKVALLRGIFKDITLTAKWVAKDVAINYDYDGGSLQREVVFMDGEEKVETVKISPFEKVGYKLLDDKANAQFNGWYNENHEREAFINNKTVDKNLTLKAQWSNINDGVEGAKIGEDATFNVHGFNYQVYQYTPLVAQTVVFESTGDIDVKAELIRKSNNTVLKSNDDISSENKNFSISYSLEANVSYLLKVSSNVSGEGTVAITTSSSVESAIPSGKINSTVYTINSSNQKFDEEFVSIGSPVKEGKVFDGWYDADGKSYTAETILKNTTINLVAHWSDAA